MKKKILFLVLCFFGIISIIYCLFSNKKIKTVFADETYSKIQVYNKEYELPVTIYLGHYDSQEDNITIKDKFKCGLNLNGKYCIYTFPATYTIYDQDDLDEMIKNYGYYCSFSVDQDADMAYGSDALSYHFLVLSYSDDLYNEEQILDYSTKSQLLNSDTEILDVLVPNTDQLDKSKFVLIKETDLLSPVLEGIDNIYLTSYDNPITVSELKTKLKAIDNFDGDISDRIQIEKDEYSDSDKSLGIYNVVFKVEDNSGNKTTLSIQIKVVDVIAPTINGPVSLVSNTSNPLNLEDIKNLFSLSDNYDSNQVLLENFKIYTDEYTENKNKIGNYKVVYKVSDSSNNETYHELKIKVVDDSKPIISGVNEYKKSTTATLNISTIMEGLIVNDNIDGNITNLLTIKEDNYSSNSTKVGTYEVIFYVTDSSNNISEDFIVTINVIDDVYPIFYIDNTFINISKLETMTKEEILDFLIKTNAINEEDITNVSWIVDEYSGNEGEVGIHKVSIKVEYEDSETKYVNLDINVLNDQNTSNSETKEEELDLFEKILNAVKNAVKSLTALLNNFVTIIKSKFNF